MLNRNPVFGTPQVFIDGSAGSVPNGSSFRFQVRFQRFLKSRIWSSLPRIGQSDMSPSPLIVIRRPLRHVLDVCKGTDVRCQCDGGANEERRPMFQRGCRIAESFLRAGQGRRDYRVLIFCRFAWNVEATKIVYASRVPPRPGQRPRPEAEARGMRPEASLSFCECFRIIKLKARG